MTTPQPLSVLQGDCREVLKSLPDESVHCCVTSPPYWGLRDYSTATWEGGDASCDHRKVGNLDSQPKSGLQGGTDTVNHAQEPQFKDVCGKCGARRIDSQIGLEPTPQAYVETLRQVFHEVRRVLRDDGTLWLNLGDCYSGSGKTGETAREAALTNVSRRWTSENGIAPKNLIGIPWRVAFALQADGWYLRSDIIWAKPNPMPESVTDRPTKSHEYLFLLAKSEKYYYDAAAIAEPSEESSGWSKQRANGKNTWAYNDSSERIRATGQMVDASTFGTFGTRNKRSVWTVPTSPYKEAHFATFPPDLIKPCILAGCPVGGMVLDPFAGSFTTCMVALELGRRCIGIELNPDYIELGKVRCDVTPGLPLHTAPAPRLKDAELPL